jgi:hypothetical protein
MELISQKQELQSELNEGGHLLAEALTSPSEIIEFNITN